MRTYSPSKLNLGLKMTILSLLGASLLTGCGISGTLKTPAPLFGGDDAKIDSNRIPTEDLDKKRDEDELSLLDIDADEPETVDPTASTPDTSDNE